MSSKQTPAQSTTPPAVTPSTSDAGGSNAAAPSNAAMLEAMRASAASEAGPTYGSLLDPDEVAIESDFATDPASSTGTPLLSTGGPLPPPPRGPAPTPLPEEDAPEQFDGDDAMESSFATDPAAAANVEQPPAYSEEPVYFLGTTTPVPSATGTKTRKIGTYEGGGGAYFDPATDSYVDLDPMSSTSTVDDAGRTTTVSTQSTTKTSLAGPQTTSDETVTIVADDPVVTAVRLKQTLDDQASMADSEADRLTGLAETAYASVPEAEAERNVARENVRLNLRKSRLTAPTGAEFDAALAADPAWQAADAEVQRRNALGDSLTQQSQEQRNLSTKLRASSAKVPVDGTATMPVLAQIAGESGVLVEPATTTSRTKTSTTPTYDSNFLDGQVSAGTTRKVEKLDGKATESTSNVIGEVGDGRLYAGGGWSTSVKDGTGQLHPDGPRNADEPKRTDGTGQETDSASMSATGGLAVKSDDEMGVGGEFKVGGGDTDRAASGVAGGEITNKGVYGHVGTTLESGSNAPVLANDDVAADVWTEPKLTVLFDGAATISAKPDGDGHIVVVTTIRAGGTVGFGDAVAGKAAGGAESGRGRSARA